MMTPITYVSLGAGVQSSALLVMSALGLKDCPRADFALFADTQDEPRWVYEQLAALRAWAEPRGMPVVTVTAGRLSDETYGHANGMKKRRAALPVFTLGKDGREAMLPRQCTDEYKLQPIRRYLRQRLSVPVASIVSMAASYRRRRIRAGSVEALIGISFEERTRIKESRQKWIVNRWPLIDAAMTRSACIALLEAHGLPVPRKSACIYCPFHDDAYWMTLLAVEPEAFKEACRFDEAIRSVSRSGLRHPVYLHRSLQPLRDVQFIEAAPSFDYGFNNECSGTCGV